MATNQMRREAAKRKLASQRERRAAQAARRRQIAGHRLGGRRRGRAPGRRGAVPRSAAAATPPPPRLPPTPRTPPRPPPQPAASRPRSPAAPTRPTAPGRGSLQHPAAPAEGVSNRQGTVSAGRWPRRDRWADRPHPGPRRGAVHGQQLRQPRRAGLLRRHGLPPPHHRRRPQGAAVRRPDRHGHRRPGLHDPGRGAHHPGLAPSSQGTVIYPRGTVAMAKTAPAELGWQPVLPVYADATLPPEYTVFGTIDDDGLADDRQGGGRGHGRRQRLG